jgi:hypothetical protein
MTDFAQDEGTQATLRPVADLFTNTHTQYTSGRFSTNYRATIGADFITKAVAHHSNPEESVQLQIWVRRSISHLYYFDICTRCCEWESPEVYSLFALETLQVAKSIPRGASLCPEYLCINH